MKNECSTETGCCETTQEAQGSCATTSCECPIEQMTSLLKSSFVEALRQAQVEAIKVRIQKAWGEKINQKADAVVEAMGAQWAAKLSVGKAEMELKEKIVKIMSENKK